VLSFFLDCLSLNVVGIISVVAVVVVVVVMSLSLCAQLNFCEINGSPSKSSVNSRQHFFLNNFFVRNSHTRLLLKK